MGKEVLWLEFKSQIFTLYPKTDIIISHMMNKKCTKNERKNKGGKTSESCRWRPSHPRDVKHLWWWAHHMRFTNISRCQLTFTGIYMLYWAFWSQTPKSASFTHFYVFHLFIFFLLSISLLIPILHINHSFISLHLKKIGTSKRKEKKKKEKRKRCLQGNY